MQQRRCTKRREKRWRKDLRTLRVVSHVGVDPSMPQIAKQQQHRSNAPAECPFEYNKKNVAILFLDHILFKLDSQFSPLLTLVPAIICARNVELDNAIQVYHDDLPSPELVPQEIIRWKLRYENLPPDKRPSTAATAIKECDSLYFPNTCIRVLLKIACTIPVTSCECEQSASKLRHLHTYMYMRASMAQERLTSLALLHIHSQGEWNYSLHAIKP